MDLEEGRAMKVFGKNYCPACLSRAIGLAKDPEHPPDHRTPRPFPGPDSSDRRRHERKDTDLLLELRIYLADDRLHDRGTAVMRNVSLSGALLSGVLLSGRASLLKAQKIGIRLLEGHLQDFEIRGRVVRVERTNEGIRVGLEFDGAERTKAEQLHAIV